MHTTARSGRSKLETYMETKRLFAERRNFLIHGSDADGLTATLPVRASE